MQVWRHLNIFSYKKKNLNHDLRNHYLNVEPLRVYLFQIKNKQDAHFFIFIT